MREAILLAFGLIATLIIGIMVYKGKKRQDANDKLNDIISIGPYMSIIEVNDAFRFMDENEKYLNHRHIETTKILLTVRVESLKKEWIENSIDTEKK